MRGQSAIEFLLIAAFLLALSAVILNSVQAQVIGTKDLRNALLVKHDLDVLTQSMNLVFVQGDGARVTRTMYFPPGAVCNFGTSPNNPLQCTVQNVGTVQASDSFQGSVIFSACACSDCWKRAQIERSAGVTVVSCTNA
ncbi:MAG TPA: hypothetical protein VGQ00_02010 [Candidatus Norongarragalinales archaeon]|jgi:hypothetical protein|nr:hypothetical protein [Candidatus Norongarragalinales archaeon]